MDLKKGMNAMNGDIVNSLVVREYGTLVQDVNSWEAHMRSLSKEQVVLIPTSSKVVENASDCFDILGKWRTTYQ